MSDLAKQLIEGRYLIIDIVDRYVGYLSACSEHNMTPDMKGFIDYLEQYERTHK